MELIIDAAFSSNFAGIFAVAGRRRTRHGEVLIISLKPCCIWLKRNLVPA